MIPAPLTKTFPAAPTLPLKEAFVKPAHNHEKIRGIANRISTAIGIGALVLGSLVRIDSAINPVWEAGLGRPDARIEHIVNDIEHSDTLVTIATIPGFNANYDDMAQAKKEVAKEYNSRLVFVRNGNKNVETGTIAKAIYEDLPIPRNNRFGETIQDSILILDGHSMGGKTALFVAAWFAERHPDIKITVVMDSTPNSTLDVQGFAAQSVVRGLSAGAPRKKSSSPTFSIGPGARLIAESINRLSEEPIRAVTDKYFALHTLVDKFRNLGAHNQPLGNSALAAEADIIDAPLPQDIVARLATAGVNIIRLSPDRDTTVYNDSSVKAFGGNFGANFCNLPVLGATHGSPNESASHAAYMARWREILGDIIGLNPQNTLSTGHIARLTIPPVPSAVDPLVYKRPLHDKCTA